MIDEKGMDILQEVSRTRYLNSRLKVCYAHIRKRVVEAVDKKSDRVLSANADDIYVEYIRVVRAVFSVEFYVNTAGNVLHRYISYRILASAVDGKSLCNAVSVYYSAMQGDKKQVAQGLRSSARFIRRELAQRLNLRMTPELTFYEDHSIAHGAHISKLLESIEFAPETDPNAETEKNEGDPT